MRTVRGSVFLLSCVASVADSDASACEAIGLDGGSVCVGVEACLNCDSGSSEVL